jgi:hypothetical protein
VELGRVVADVDISGRIQRPRVEKWIVVER